MTILVTEPRAVLLLVVGLLVCSVAKAQDDPHWSKTKCQTCHLDANPVAGSLKLKEADVETLCTTCHGSRGDAGQCRHGSGYVAGSLAMPENFSASLQDGRVVCTTCHDVVYQCEHPTKPYSFMNPGFLRDRKSPVTSRYCFECHEESAYKKLNPHQEATETSTQATCLLCHSSLPEKDQSSGLTVALNMMHDLNDACRGCHNVRPHPGNAFSGKAVGWEHLTAPPENILNNMRTAEAEAGIALPLSPINGEVYCATCHNPHGSMTDTTDQQTKHRLRAKDICQACHDK